MKLKAALAFALLLSISPALAHARMQSVSLRQHGAGIHDRSPHMRTHASQPHR